MPRECNPNIHCQECESREKSVFCDLPKEHLVDIDSTKTVNQYKPHQTLFYQGNNPYGLYCLKSGKVKVVKMDVDGNQHIVRIAGPGDVLGYRSLLADDTYSASAETIEDSTICFIDRSIFTHILDSHPKTASLVMKMMAQELKRAEEQEVNLVHRSVGERLAELLLVFNNRYGKKTKEGSELELALTRQEWAEIVGTTQESVIRLLSDFKKQKMINTSGKKIVILDMDALVEYANIYD